MRATLTILNRESGSIHIAIASGLSSKELERANIVLEKELPGVSLQPANLRL